MKTYLFALFYNGNAYLLLSQVKPEVKLKKSDTPMAKHKNLKDDEIIHKTTLLKMESYSNIKTSDVIKVSLIKGTIEA
jgi:hypothetical protein